MAKKARIDGENLFLLVNGYSGHHSVGIMHVFKGLPVVLLRSQDSPYVSPGGLFSFENCSLLVMGECIEYEKCVLKLIE